MANHSGPIYKKPYFKIHKRGWKGGLDQIAKRQRPINQKKKPPQVFTPIQSKPTNPVV